jgi:hypothetical protein
VKVEVVDWIPSFLFSFSLENNDNTNTIGQPRPMLNNDWARR